MRKTIFKCYGLSLFRNTNKYTGLLLSALGILGLFACGGGGGDGNAVIVPPAPTGLTYTGVTSQAVIDSKNAAKLAIGAFIGGETGSDFGIFSAVKDDHSKIVREIKLYEVVQIFGGALYKIDFNSHRGDSLAIKTEQDIIPGDCGGSASYTVEMDDATGTFTGSMTFNDYCSENTTISGTASFFGQVDINTGDFFNFNLSFNMVSLTSGNEAYVIDGDVSVDESGPSSTATLDMLMKDNFGEVFWVNDYMLIISEGVDYFDVNATGRFYNPTYGYVDLSTITPVRTYNIYEWPSSGELQIIGGEGTKAQLIVVDENFLRIIADTNGDGNYNYDTGQISWSDL
jgi:hypothetical protein